MRGRGLALAAVAAAALSAAASAEILAISDQGYPYLNLMEPFAPVVWHERSFAARMAASSGVRINSRGIRFIHPEVSGIVLRPPANPVGAGSPDRLFDVGADHAAPTAAPPDRLFDVRAEPLWGAAPPSASSGWVSTPCTIAPGCLCRIDAAPSPPGRGEILMRAFPSPGGPAYAAPVDANSSLPPAIPRSAIEALGGGCPEASTGRTRLLGASGGGANGSAALALLRWDISVCNVIGSGGDFVFLPYTGQLFALQRPIPFQMVVVISILTMVMAIILAHNLEFSLGTTSSPTRTATSLFCMAALLLCSLFATGHPDILLPYVTREDRVACLAVLCYVCYYTCRIASEALYAWAYAAGDCASEAYAHSPVNPVLATLSMVTLRLYSTMDNPYTTGILFLLGTRLLHKLTIYSAAATPPRPLHAELLLVADVVADCCLVSVYAYAGLVPQYSSDPTSASLLLLQGVYAAITLSSVMASVRRPQAAAAAAPGKP